MTKKSSPEAKREKKLSQLLERSSLVMNSSLEKTREQLGSTLIQSVRINPLVDDPEMTLRSMYQLGWRGQKVSWCNYGYSIDEGFEQLRDSSLVANGAIYIQNESSWLPVVLLDALAGNSVLDICAAPGGKTSHIAATMHNSGRLVANDNSRPRLAKLAANLKRLGVEAELTLYDATRLSHNFNEPFDKILLDAPCSGEGLIDIRKRKTLDTWSIAHIRRLSQLQKKLIFQGWKLLKPGGRLVYSTCTMAPEEDEGVVNWLLKRQPDAHVIEPIFRTARSMSGIPAWNGTTYAKSLERAIRIFPGEGREAFFVCVLEKSRDV
ncbi:MAG TPA: RsmB/NOP family class I SAM-dependent RNA methyltransferase [Candidatus Saccharimonadales bacterium]|nr:RsmB/NOP family class I SAM-dependent RNA methyltransferase [Candidatus Saccharimonadales bacterium]